MTDTSPSGVAPSVWLRPQRGSRGPASQWSRDDVAAAGVLLADTAGLGAVTMRSIAAALGTAGASLYRIVDSRDHVLELMADRVIGEFDYADAPAGAGDDGLLRLAVQARAIYARHPWMLAISNASPALGPNAMTYLDHALGTIADLGLTRRQRLEAVGIVSGLVRVLALDDARSGQGRLSAEWHEALTANLRAATDADAHPFLSRALLGAESITEGPDDRFESVLRPVIAALLHPSKRQRR